MNEMKRVQLKLRGGVIVNVALTVIGLIFSGLVLFGFNVLVGRTYGAATLGEISIVLGLALFLSQASSTVGFAATKFMGEALGRGERTAAKATFQFTFLLNTILAGLLALGLMIGSPWINALLHVSIRSIILGAMLVVAYALYLFFKAVYYGLNQVGIYVRNEIVSDVAFFGLLAAVLILHAPVWLLVPLVLNNVIFAAIAIRDLREYFHGFTWRVIVPWQAIVRYWVVSGTGTATGLARYSLGTTITGLFLSHHQVGLYAAAGTLEAPLRLLPRALSLVLFATMVRLHGAGRASSLAELLQLSTEWLVFVSSLVCGLLIINASFILHLLFRPEYMQATLAAQIIVLGAYLLIISNPAISALSSTTYVRIPTLASLLGFAVSVVLWLVLVPFLGITGAAIGLAAGSAVLGGIPALFACRFMDLQYTTFLRVGGILIMLLAALPFADRAPFLITVVFVVFLAVFYARSGAAVARRALQIQRAVKNAPLDKTVPQ
jgi:O-antigen/teichoic acid export membrane protein